MVLQHVFVSFRWFNDRRFKSSQSPKKLGCRCSVHETWTSTFKLCSPRGLGNLWKLASDHLARLHCLLSPWVACHRFTFVELFEVKEEPDLIPTHNSILVHPRYHTLLQHAAWHLEGATEQLAEMKLKHMVCQARLNDFGMRSLNPCQKILVFSRPWVVYRAADTFVSTFRHRLHVDCLVDGWPDHWNHRPTFIYILQLRWLSLT